MPTQATISRVLCRSFRSAATYIKADATELPALYEVKDGKPALLNFQVHQGTYVVPTWRDGRAANDAFVAGSGDALRTWRQP